MQQVSNEVDQLAAMLCVIADLEALSGAVRMSVAEPAAQFTGMAAGASNERSSDHGQHP